MKQKVLTALIILLTVVTMKAQDKLYYKNNEAIDVKVIKVTDETIEYKKFNNLEGPVFVEPISKINMVVYENGDHQIYNKEEEKRQNKIPTHSQGNRINVDLLAYGENGPISAAYEFLNSTGSRGIEIPVNVHFNVDGIVGITSGVNVKFYVTKRGRGFYVGPSLGIGVFNWYTDYNYYYYDEEAKFSVYLGPKLGYQYQISDLFGIHLGGTVGTVSNFTDIDLAYSGSLGINFSF